MKKLLAVAAVFSALNSLNAQTMFEASIDAAQDGGGARTGSGFGSFTLTDNDLSYSITYSGLSGNSTVAHIHGPAAPGSSASPIHDLLGGTFGSQSGSFNGTWVDMTPAQISDLQSGLHYVNIHSTTFGGGEIRGQITVVPEPSTLALLASGVVFGVVALRRRKRQ